MSRKRRKAKKTQAEFFALEFKIIGNTPDDIIAEIQQLYETGLLHSKLEVISIYPDEIRARDKRKCISQAR